MQHHLYPSPALGTAMSNRIYMKMNPPICVGFERGHWGAKSKLYNLDQCKRVEISNKTGVYGSVKTLSGWVYLNAPCYTRTPIVIYRSWVEVHENICVLCGWWGALDTW